MRRVIVADKPATCRLHVVLSDQPMLLQRLLVTCARRRCDIVAMTYEWVA
jgi:hypothetical protein